MSNSELQKQMDALKEIERGIVPDPAWVLRQRETLLMQVRNSMPVHDTLLHRWQIIMRQFFPNTWKQIFRAPTLAVFSLLGVVTGGSLMGVSAAEKSLPGDVLYPVKIAAEQTRMLFANGKIGKVKLKAEFVSRRADEIKEIATTDVTKRQERLHEATEILKRDLDTVSLQLNEAATQNSVSEVAMAARAVDEASTSLASTLKGVRIILPDDEKDGLNEAEVAAVKTGVKAVQVLIDSQEMMEEKDAVVSPDQLKESIQNKVQGMEDHMADAELRIFASSGTLIGANASTTPAGIAGAEAVSSTTQQIKNAQQSLTETRQLLEENNMQKVRERLGDAATIVNNVEKNMIALPAVATSTPATGDAAATSTTTSTGSTNNVRRAPESGP